MVFCKIRPCFIEALLVGTAFQCWVIELRIVIFPATNGADLKSTGWLFM